VKTRRFGMTRRAAALAALVAFAPLLAGCGSGNHEADRTAAEPAAVSGLTVAAAGLERIPVSRELAGTVQASTVSQVAARVMAQVLTVSVREGDRVAKGQLLVTLDGRELAAKGRQAESALRQAEAGKRQAESQLELAATTLARFEKLLAERAVSRQEFDQVAAQERMARAGVAQAESAVAQAAGAVEEAATWLGFTELRASASGRVSARRIEPGSMAAPGMPLLAIEHEGSYRVEVPVDSSLAGSVARGSSLAVRIEAAGFEAPVPVTEVVSAADPVSRTFVVKAALPASPRLASGQYAQVRVTVGEREAVVVPDTALVRRGQLDGVYVESGGKLAFRIVQPGQPVGVGVREILSGLTAGERIVVAGADRAVDGARLAADGS